MVGTIIFGFVMYELFTPFKALKWLEARFNKLAAGLNAEELADIALDNRGFVNRAYLEWQDATYGHMDSLLPVQFVRPEDETPENAKFHGMFVLTNEHRGQVLDAIWRNNVGLEQVVNVDFLLHAGRAAWNVPELRKEALVNAKRIAAAKQM